MNTALVLYCLIILCNTAEDQAHYVWTRAGRLTNFEFDGWKWDPSIPQNMTCVCTMCPKCSSMQRYKINDFHKSWLKFNEVHLRIVYVSHIICKCLMQVIHFCSITTMLLGIVNVLNTVIQVTLNYSIKHHQTQKP